MPAGYEQLDDPRPPWPGCQESELNDSVTPASPVTSHPQVNTDTTDT